MADWNAWHRNYDDPASGLAQRLATVRAELDRLLTATNGRPTRLLSLCAGDGRDTLPVLAAGHDNVRAVLVEIDAGLGAAAQAQASQLNLPHVEVRTADAGVMDTYADLPPADVLLACGVFGNISDDDLETTVGAFPRLLTPGAAVLWTRGASTGDDDPTSHPGDAAELVRKVFTRHGFVEERFIRPDDAGFRVGVHRLADAPRSDPTGRHLFRFTR
ncbi:class I SAM-dependent methyltransferase [Frankia sp. AgB1.9]|uniref:class I SAM-dependent methyltransferase n=1 Tax=unclassified Frankia TaxID=2632575 RepID=UPI0019314172|nr:MULTISPECIES: class I SAM-dependent methyltransferase [unclassified Frankia]MBL7490420.1 class I SAM-dependent methyltransferase [Frankia sp. AgW1.1]MBL7554005.1 class I SAM-dependent methyltransferase [Frankia sp. AgB1.9]MBL7624633.1 class I SAM-dependent methyltransferase [Frankia sp. AgB1.8]